MLDAMGREIDYLRISVTDRCNLRCVYCMPENGIQMSKHEDILTYDEIKRLCIIFSSMGVKYIRITGGEPLVRRNITELIKEIKAVKGIEKVTLTTNGVLLESLLPKLYESGIDGINVSLDSMDRETYAKMTRCDVLPQVLNGIKCAYDMKIPLKINCVSMQKVKGSSGLEDAERILQVAEYAKNHTVDIRFIELMPIGYGKESEFLSEDEIKRMLESKYGVLTCDEKIRGNGPGHYYSIDGFAGRIGFISAMSHKFCDSCNRVRLTSQGYLKSCLQYNIGTDLRELLRNQGTDEEIEAAARLAIQNKPAGHQFRETVIEKAECSCMSQIGG